MIAQELKEQVWGMLQKGEIKPIVNKIYPLAQVKDAHEYMESGDLTGKIILINN
ncbi:zinc-binding dehydrogenase [Providencia sp. PROV112]|uniref:zinc-binding dehydrogenase n=1 Tax=Providencia sp. PROV112 TaxID=2949823 RepID=UPI00300E14B4